jgi:hypothetical protein
MLPADNELENLDQESSELELDPELEAEAREMGWKPLEEFSGDKKNWKPAEEFVSRGREILPIVNAHKKKLQEDLRVQKMEKELLWDNLRETQEALNKMQQNFIEAQLTAAEFAKKDIQRAIIEARQSGDAEREMELQESLDEISEELKSLETEEPTKFTVKKVDPASLAEKQWYDENSWFGTDIPRTEQFLADAQKFRASGTGLTGLAFLEQVRKMQEDSRNSDTKSIPPQKTITRGSRASGTGVSTFNMLDKEAQLAIDSFAPVLVGAGKKYKTISELRESLAPQYRSAKNG